MGQTHERQTMMTFIAVFIIGVYFGAGLTLAWVAWCDRKGPRQ